MIRIEMLPARHGDCLLVEYGTGAAVHRLLIDGGTPETLPALRTRLEALGPPVALELLVVTHIDADHIGGVLALIEKAPGLVAPADVWFNAYKHLSDVLGAAQGEKLSSAILASGFHWNMAFKEKSVVVPNEGALPTVPLAGGATITLLSPYWPDLGRLRTAWEKEVKEAGIEPGSGAQPSDVLGKRPPPITLDVDALASDPFQSDTAPANGSSIAFLFEYGHQLVLFGADAHPGVLERSIERLGDTPLELAACKLSHHGSRGNTSAALLGRIRCPKFLVSTSSAVFGHPDPETLARIVERPGSKTLYFNYESDYTRPWLKASLKSRYDYSVVFGNDPTGHLVVVV